MRRICWLLVAGYLAFLQGSTAAVTRSELSPGAQALLPPGDFVTLKLKDGRVVNGEQVGAQDGKIVIRTSIGSITSKREFSKAEIAEVIPMNLAEYLATALKKYETDPKNSLPADQYQPAIALFDEFLQKWPDSPDARWIRERRALFAGEWEKVRLGMERVDGKWMAPVQSAVVKYRKLSAGIAEIKKQHSDIEQGTTKAGSKIKKQFDRMLEDRRTVARNLPTLMRGRIPQLLSQKNYEEATAEMDVFVRFWLARVMKGEAESSDRTLWGETPFESMDFGVIMGMQRQILEYSLSPVTSAPPASVTAATGTENMVYVPGGLFLMGREDAKLGDPDFPMRLVYLSPYWIDKFEVSNADYQKFLDQMKATGDVSVEHPSAPPMKNHTPVCGNNSTLNRELQPVTGVDWFDAYAYAKWSGKRLPTEAEWEFAARSMDWRAYPWGSNAPARAVVNSMAGRRFLEGEMNRQKPLPPPKSGGWLSCSCEQKPPPAPPSHTLPLETWDVDQVLAPKALSLQIEWTENVLGPYGTYHMAGNAAEWVNDWYDPAAYSRMEYKNPQGPTTGKQHVFRGGSYLSTDDRELTTYYRGFPANDLMLRGCATDNRPMIGFRCVRDIPGKAEAK